MNIPAPLADTLSALNTAMRDGGKVVVDRYHPGLRELELYGFVQRQGDGWPCYYELGNAGTSLCKALGIDGTLK